MSKIGFARVSTKEQELEGQIAKLKDAGCERIEQGKHSGKADENRAALERLLDYVREGDTVVVTKLDRLGRSLSQVLNVIDTLTERNINLIALDQNIDTSNSDPMSRAMVQLLGMFAEMERNFIVSRTQEGKERTGNYGGRKPALTEEDKAAIRKQKAEGVSQNKLSGQYGVSRATIARACGYEK